MDDLPTASRGNTVYRHEHLRRVLAPDSIAVYGASARAGSFGERTLENLRHFQGRLYAVNPKYDSVAGVRCYPSLDALPESPDCVIIVSNRDAVRGMVDEAVRAEAGGVIIYAAGYSETGRPENAALQQDLAEVAQWTGMPIIGPNCMGIQNYVKSLYGTFTEISIPTQPISRTAVGLVSQSGALGASLWQSIDTGASVSHLLTAGNSCDVDVADYIAYLAEDPDCKAIGCLFEGSSNPQRLLEAARIAWENDKPLVIYKIATGQQGAEAAVSHTGSLAGSNEAYMAAFEKAGIVVVHDLEALVETTRMFAKAPKEAAEGVAVLSASGGAAVIAADKAEEHAVALPQPGAATTETLLGYIPEFGSARNPTDVTAQVLSNPDSLAASCNALLDDPAYGALVMMQVSAAERTTPRISMLGDLGRRHGKLTCLVWMSKWANGPGSFTAESDDNVALFHSADRCFAALAAWHRYMRRRRAAQDAAPQARLSPPDAAKAARAILDTAGAGPLTERQSKEVLACYGIGVTRERLAQTADEAVEIAQELGFPLVLKVESPDIPHKTEAGVIRLGLGSADAVRLACAEILENARRAAPEGRINGILVQQMVPSGLEIVIGARTVPGFGPLILVGLGGIFVELLRDTATRLAPVSRDEAAQMLAALRAQAALDGFRGGAGVDRTALAETIVRVSEMVTDLDGYLEELDVNPLVCDGRKIVAVDALVVRSALCL